MARKENPRVMIVTTAHWSGDPRLGRHVRYLNDIGLDASITAFQSGSRVGRLVNVLKVARLIWSHRPYAVILPDPELFVVGAVTARLRGTKAVIDIHEDYARAARGREWIPDWVKPGASTLARLNTWLGIVAANTTLVAAPELSTGKSVLVQNTPNPTDFEMSNEKSEPPTAIYVGDVTEARGALVMAELARRLPGIRFLVVGRVSDDLAERMVATAGPEDLELLGRLPHEEAWALARGAAAGLSLLEPLPAYQDAVATKLWEYCSAGIPPVVSSLRGQSDFVGLIDPALAVENIDEAEELIGRLVAEPEWAKELSARARIVAEEAWDKSRPDRALQAALVPRPITLKAGPSAEN
jgi:glycosyltransferase involved in cell wall biosynthesis